MSAYLSPGMFYSLISDLDIVDGACIATVTVRHGKIGKIAAFASAAGRIRLRLIAAITNKRMSSGVP